MPVEDEFTAKEKLRWLGLSEAAQSLSNVESELETLENELSDYAEFKDDLENGNDYDNDGTVESIDSKTSFDSYLQDNGFTEQLADDFVTKIEQNFTDENSSGSEFDEFKTFALDQNSFEQLRSGFGSSSELTSELETGNGQAAAGIKFHESAGVTRGGVSVPSGTTEVYGQQIHFSEADAPTTSTGESGGFTVSNISASDQFPLIGETVTISVDVESTYSQQAYFSASLIEDGSEVANQGVTISGGTTETVSFDVTENTFVSHAYAISSSAEVNVGWIPDPIDIY